MNPKLPQSTSTARGMPASVAVPCCGSAISSHILPMFTLIAGTTLHLAKGFGTPPSKSSPNSPSDPSSSLDRELRSKRRSEKATGGRVVPCKKCGGTGKKICQFCEGTTLMVGFLGNRVPCVPCEGTGTLGMKCKECGGDGYTVPKT